MRYSMETCVICGEPIPEGRMVCPKCEKRWKIEQTKNDDEQPLGK